MPFLRRITYMTLPPDFEPKPSWSDRHPNFQALGFVLLVMAAQLAVGSVIFLIFGTR